MSRNIIFVLMYHRHEHLELIYYKEMCLNISCHKGTSTIALYIKTKMLMQSKQVFYDKSN
jgi:hypothetical protein